MRPGPIVFLNQVPNSEHFCSVSFSLAEDKFRGLDFQPGFCLLIDQLERMLVYRVNQVSVHRIWNSVSVSATEIKCLPLGPVPKLEGTTDIKLI